MQSILSTGWMKEIYKEKYSLLISPYEKEEIDYIVKSVSKVKEQLKFDTFKHMVACKNTV